MKKNISTIVLVIVFCIGLGLLLYPSVSDYWNSFHQSKAIASYVDAVDNISQQDYDKILKNARQYNKELSKHPTNWILDEQEIKEYNKQLDITGTGIMGYIDIPEIRCSLPIYHGTDEGVLQIAIGHIPGSSLPVGGKSTHCVLSGHRGLPSARLFTDIDQLKEGDIFMIRTLNETFTYEVDQIRIVLPDEMDSLQIEEGKDLCTLVTCTPYGINTHRLLVRGHRVANRDTDARTAAEALQIKPMIVAAVIMIVFLLLLSAYYLLIGKRKRKMRGDDNEKI